MRRARNVALALAGALLMFMAYRFIVLTKNDTVLWFVIERKAALTADGKPADGWLHRESKNRAVFVTWNRSGKRASYLVTYTSDPRRSYVQQCPEWTAPHFPIFSFPNFTSEALLCIGWNTEWNPERYTPMNPNVIVGTGTFEFAADDGSVIQARWK
jgi:hypothetical protein